MSRPMLVQPEGVAPFTLTTTLQQTATGESSVPIFTEENVVRLVRWLWHLDLRLTYDQDDRAPTETYLLDDLMMVLRGGVFAVAYPTDYGKSTLIDMSCVLALIFWPDSIQTIVKATKEAAAAAAMTVYWKLVMAAEALPYCRPLCGTRNGNPEVGQGFWVEGSRLRAFGGRDRSLYAAGIADSSLPGRRGRAHFDDLETENVVKSQAKMDTLRKQINACIRLLQANSNPLFLIAGTPAGGSSVMYVAKDFQVMGVPSKFIHRPRVIQEGPNQGKLLFPSREQKANMQKGLMTPAAFRIAYELKPPGSENYDGLLASEKVKDPEFPVVRNESQLREFLFARRHSLIRAGLSRPPEHRPGLGALGGVRSEQDVLSRTELAMRRLAIYASWDPATVVGTHALSLVALEDDARWIIRSQITSETEDEQARVIRDWRRAFPSLVAVVENDGQQRAFATVLSMVDPMCPYDFHSSTKQNTADGYHAGLPRMMQEIMVGLWHLSWPDPETGEDMYGALLSEIKRWGPVDHPHGLPSLWFAWHYNGCGQARVEPAPAEPDAMMPAIASGAVPSAPELWSSPGLWGVGGAARASSQSREAWNRRWRSYR